MVLVHGFNETSTTWNEIATTLAVRYRVLLYDLRGHGRSAPSGTDYSTRRMAGELAGLFEAVGIASAAIVGHSAGGRIAIRFAQWFPDRTRALVVEDMHIDAANASGPIDPARFERLRAIPERFATRDEARSILRPVYADDTEFVLRKWLVASNDGAFRLTFRPHVNYVFARQVLAEDLGDALRAIRCPALFLAGDASNTSSELVGARLEHMRGLRPDLRYVTIPGAGHQIHRSRPDAFLREVETFLG